MTDASSPAPAASPAPTSSPSSGEPGIAFWQDPLANEHAVIWAYGMVGATGDLADAAEAELRRHRARRATCIDAVTALGGQPVASAPAYDVKNPPSEAAARQLAVALEAQSTAVYAALAGSTDRQTRLRAAGWLRESAIAQTRWGDEIPALPGFETSPVSPAG
ncbi:MAG: ferritin-like domain-containing protein [Actinomycetes bacterium]